MPKVAAEQACTSCCRSSSAGSRVSVTALTLGACGSAANASLTPAPTGATPPRQKVAQTPCAASLMPFKTTDSAMLDSDAMLQPQPGDVCALHARVPCIITVRLKQRRGFRGTSSPVLRALVGARNAIFRVGTAGGGAWVPLGWVRCKLPIWCECRRGRMHGADQGGYSERSSRAQASHTRPRRMLAWPAGLPIQNAVASAPPTICTVDHAPLLLPTY